MSTPIAALEANGISIELANTWILSQLNNPTAIFNTAKTFGLTSTDIANIVAVSMPSANAALVESFFNTRGFNSSELTGTPTEVSEPEVTETPASSSDPVLSNAEIHQLIQAKINFEDTRGVEIIQLAAVADIQSSYDGEAAVFPGQAGYDQLIASYNGLDFDDEQYYIGKTLRGSNDVPSSMHFTDDSYNQMFMGWENEFSSVQDPIKAFYDDVLRMNDDFGMVIDLTDDSGNPYNPNNDLVIFDTQANQNTIAAFSDNDDLYIFDGKAHFLGTTGGSAVGTAAYWARSHSSELSDNVIDFFIFDNGSDTYIVAEKVENQTYNSATNASDFSILTLTGVASSDLAYNDGFIAYA